MLSIIFYVETSRFNDRHPSSGISVGSIEYSQCSQVLAIPEESSLKVPCLLIPWCSHPTGFGVLSSYRTVFNQVEESFEQLSTVGSVAVVKNNVAWPYVGFEFVIEFQPWEDDDLSHYLNYGDMPSISVRNPRP